jgi:type VI secretion system secreted protein Hcp
MASHGDMFLKLKSAKGGVIKGDARDAAYADAIDVASFAWGMRSTSSMSGAGKTVRSTLDSIQITKHADSASAALMGVLRSNDPVTEAQLIVRKASGHEKPIDFFTIKIKDGRIVSYDVAFTHDDPKLLVEKLTLSFRSIEITHKGQRADGGTGSASVFQAESLDSGG